MTAAMFNERELTAGQTRYDDSVVPFEPQEDPFYSSERLIHKVRDVIVTFDAVTGFSPEGDTILAANLRTLAQLASAAADHIDHRIKEAA